MATQTWLDDFEMSVPDGGALEPGVASQLVELKADYLGDAEPGRWRSGDLREVLLDLVPRKVTADDAWLATVIPTTRAFLEYAAVGGHLHPESAPLPALLHELDIAAKEFDEAAHDRSRFGAAKAIMMTIAERNGLEPDELMSDPERLNRLIAEYNQQPLGGVGVADFEDDDFGADEFEDDEDDEEDDLAGLAQLAVFLPTPAQSVEQMRATRAFGALTRIRDWLGDGVPVDQDGTLAPDLQRQLQAAVAGPDDVRLGLPSGELWEALQRFEALELDDGLARPGDHWDALLGQARADESLSAWTMFLLATISDRAVALPAEHADDPAVMAALAQSLLFFVGGHYLGRPQSVDSVVEQACAYLDPDQERAVREAVPSGLPWLRDLGLLAEPGVGQDETPDDDDDGSAKVPVTELGLAVAHVMVGTVGGARPRAITQPETRSVDEMLAEMRWLTRDQSLAWAGAWFAARDSEAAIEALVGAAEVGLPARRLHALEALHTLLPEERFAALVTEHAHEPLLGPLLRVLTTRHLLFTQPDCDPEDVVADVAARFGEDSSEQRLMLLVEAVARQIQDVEPPVRSDDVGLGLWSMMDDALVAGLITLPHPQLLDVLDGISTGHPRGRVRKAAKKAAHQLRHSRGRPADTPPTR